MNDRTVLDFNFILPTKIQNEIPANTVGLYIQSLIGISKSIAGRVFYNGQPLENVTTSVKSTTFASHPLARYAPAFIANYVRDYKLFQGFSSPPSSFKEGAINFVFFVHQQKLPQLLFDRKDTRLVCLFDEPPSFGDNFKTRFFYAKAKRRFLKDLNRFDSFWTYHGAATQYVHKNVADARILTFPAMLDYSPPSSPEKLDIQYPLKVVMASSFLPWHGTTEVLDFLQPLLAKQLIHLTFIGDGPSKAATVEKSKHFPGVTFIEKLDFQAYKVELRQFDFGILPMIPWFNSPLKLMDYVRAGIGVVTFESSAIQSIWPREAYMNVEEFTSVAENLSELSAIRRRTIHSATDHMKKNWGKEQIEKHLIKLSK